MTNVEDDIVVAEVDIVLSSCVVVVVAVVNAVVVVRYKQHNTLFHTYIQELYTVQEQEQIAQIRFTDSPTWAQCFGYSSIASKFVLVVAYDSYATFDNHYNDEDE